MKHTSLLLILAALCGGGNALANPKGLGPSAIEAAHLKVHPPRNYLAHYLPDDRYKIAGGVWRFVSTDLDTYYHLPQSANMMRQPADRVIGFANAADAEEAGYIADPTDGTANATQAAIVDINPEAIGGDYRSQVMGLLGQSRQNMRQFLTKLMAIKPNQDATRRGGLPPEFRQIITEQQTQQRLLTNHLSALHPPARYRRFHSLLLSTLRMGSTSSSAANKMLLNGDLTQIGQLQTQLMRALSLQQALLQEGARVGIDLNTLR